MRKTTGGISDKLQHPMKRKQIIALVVLIFTIPNTPIVGTESVLIGAVSIKG